MWVVVSVLTGLPAFGIAYDAQRSDRVYLEVPEPARGYESDAFARFMWRQYRSEPIAGCDPATLKMFHSYEWTYVASCDRTPWSRTVRSLGLATLPGLLIGLIGFVIMWVYRGFRPKA